MWSDSTIRSGFFVSRVLFVHSVSLRFQFLWSAFDSSFNCSALWDFPFNFWSNALSTYIVSIWFNTSTKSTLVFVRLEWSRCSLWILSIFDLCNFIFFVPFPVGNASRSSSPTFPSNVHVPVNVWLLTPSHVALLDLTSVTWVMSTLRKLQLFAKFYLNLTECLAKEWVISAGGDSGFWKHCGLWWHFCQSYSWWSGTTEYFAYVKI